MPIQQITVVPAKETASSGKSAARSKDKTEVSYELFAVFLSLRGALKNLWLDVFLFFLFCS